MPTQDVLEIITATGDVQFYGLDPAKGVTNIGRHPDNDIVIESPDVAPFHAVLLHQRKPYQLTLLDPGGKTRLAGQTLSPNAPQTLQAWDTIELDGCSLVFMEDAAGASPAGPVIVRSGPGGISAPAFVPPPLAPPAPTAVPSPAAPAPAAVPPSAAPAQPPVPLALERSEHAPAPPLPAAEEPLPPPSSFLLPSTLPVVDQADEVILASLSQREFTLNVEQVASFDVTLINGGDIVATLVVSVEGLNPAWVTISPPTVNLNEGERATVQVTITPPRLPSTRAGSHYFGLTVHSPNYPGRLSRTGVVLHVNPYYEYTVDEISPRQQNIPWRKRAGRASFSLANLGNSEVPYRLDAADDENACQFEFQVSENGASLAKQAEVRLAPEAGQTVGLTIAPLRRRFFGWSGHTHSVTVNVTPLEGLQTPRAVLAQAQSLPLIGPWHVFFLLLLAAILIALAFRPSVGAFSANPPEVLSSEIMGGKKVELSYRVSWFARASIDPQVGRLEGTQGAVEVAPTETTTYRITATDFLTFLYPPWFSDSREFTVVVDPVTPIVRFSVDKDQLIVGESATLSWEVLNAEVVVLKTNGAPETLPADRHTGSLQVSPQIETTYTLEARNAYTTGDGIVQTIIVNAVNPTPTPLPLPVIQRFDALPNPITAGDEVTLEWAVTGVDEVQIEPLGAFPPSGRTVVKPDQTTAYQLVASNGQAAPVRSLREVVVNPAPTATPVPGTPRIDVFTISTNEVALGTVAADNVQLAWSVSGDVANIELSGQTLGRLSGLERQGTRIVSLGSTPGTYEFVLSANNGPERTASQTVKVSLIVPVPSISGLNPAAAFVGSPGFILTVTGANFVPGSVVRWNGVDRPTVYVSGFQLTASITASDISGTGEFQVTVFNPAAAGGSASGPVAFKVNNPTPIAANLDPQVAVAGDPDTTITVLGTGFVDVSVVRFNRVDLETTFNSSTELRAVIPKDMLAEAGSFSVTVFNPAPVGGNSGGLTFTVENPRPAITALGPPSFAIVGGPTFFLTVTGSGFVGGENGSKVYWAGVEHSTVFNSPTQLQANIPAGDLLEVRSVQVAVINPPPARDGGVSNTMSFEIRKNGTSVNVVASPPTSVSGQQVTFTAHVSANPGGLQIPIQGAVVFSDQNGAVLGTCSRGNINNPPPACWTDDPVSASITTCTPEVPACFPASTVSLRAQFDGASDPNFDNSAFTPFNYTVGAADVNVNVSSTTNPTSFISPINLVAQVLPAAPGSTNPCAPSAVTAACLAVSQPGAGSGRVTFLADGTALAGPVLASPDGLFRLTVPAGMLATGNRTITAQYDGQSDPNFKNGTSQPYLHTVTKINPTVTLTASPTSSTYGQQVTITASVSSPVAGYSFQNQSVEFRLNDAHLAFATLNAANQASYTFTSTQLTGGTHKFRVNFTGDAVHEAGSAEIPNFVVNRAATNILLAGTASIVLSPTTGSWTAGVTSAAGIPTGTVNFVFRSQYASGSCNSGPPWQYNSPTNATLDAAGLATRTEQITNSEGAFRIEATYAGNQNFLPSATAVREGVKIPCVP